MLFHSLLFQKSIIKVSLPPHWKVVKCFQHYDTLWGPINLKDLNVSKKLSTCLEVFTESGFLTKANITLCSLHWLPVVFSRQAFIAKCLGSRTPYLMLEHSLSSGTQPASVFSQNPYSSILLFFKHFKYVHQLVTFTLTLLPGHSWSEFCLATLLRYPIQYTASLIIVGWWFSTSHCITNNSH